MEERNVLAAIILNDNNEVLIQKKDLGHPWTPGAWCFFGGKLEENKDPKELLKEILKKKLGVEIEVGEFFKVHPTIIEYPKGTMKCNDLVYICRFRGKISDIKLNEGAGFAFLDKSEIDSYPITKHGKEILKEYFLGYRTRM